MKPNRALTGSHPDTGSSELAGFDEQQFVRSARSKALRRNILVSAAAVMCGILIVATAWIASEQAIWRNYDRVASYMSELVPLSEPNTFVLDQCLLEGRLSGARTVFRTYRPVGMRPMPKDEVSVEFDVWGGEVIEPRGSLGWDNPKREFSGTQMAPSLRFLYPGQNGRATRPGGQEDIAQMDALSRSARIRLASAPDSATAELAISFRELKTADEMRALIGNSVILNWGAVDVWGQTVQAFPTHEGNMVGISFVGPDGAETPFTTEELEKDLPSRLRSIAERAPQGTAARCLQSAAYIEKNGVKYYGAVVTGPVRELRRLLDEEEVSAAVLGFVVQPWE